MNYKHLFCTTVFASSLLSCNSGKQHGHSDMGDTLLVSELLENNKKYNGKTVVLMARIFVDKVNITLCDPDKNLKGFEEYINLGDRWSPDAATSLLKSYLLAREGCTFDSSIPVGYNFPHHESLNGRRVVLRGVFHESGYGKKGTTRYEIPYLQIDELLYMEGH
jgi:hypothetical protein